MGDKNVSYTEQHTAEIIGMYLDDPTKETVAIIAEKFDRSNRAIVAKLASEGVYNTPVRKRKTGEDIETKEQMMIQISTWLGHSMPTLVKSGRADLKMLRDSLQHFFTGLES